MAYEKSGADEATPMDKMSVLGRYLDTEVTDSEAKALLAELAATPAAEKAAVLRAGVKKLGYDGPCPLVSLFGPDESPTQP